MGSRLLLADDSITIQKVVGIIFANEDYELTVVDNGDAALDKARETRPDVMLVDALMPGKSGYEVCAAARRDPALMNVPILLMTGAFEPFDEDKARESGADDFISKPFESQQLIDKVRGLLALAASRPAVAAVAAAAPIVAAVPAEPATFELEEVLSPPAAEPSVSFAELELAEFSPVTEVFPPTEVATVELSPAVETSVSAGQFFGAVEEVSTTDDLWGAFELEDEVPGEDAGLSTGVTTEDAAGAFVDIELAAEPLLEPSFGGVAAGAEGIVEFGVPAEEEFVLSTEAEPAVAALQEAVPAASPEPFSFESVATEPVDPFSFGMEEVAAPAPEPAVAFAEPAVASFAPLAAEPVPFSVEQQFAPEEEFVPAPEALAPAAAPGTITLTEEQLAAAVSRIAKEVIERIAWEVVPDLAEVLIKEEIRKIKNGI